MKKDRTRDQEQNRKPRRLSLSRETIRILNDPALLELARGGVAPAEDAFAGSGAPKGCCGTGSDTHQGG